MTASREDADRYAVAPGMSFIVQSRGVLVQDELARRGETLLYAEAAVWELLAAGHRTAEVAMKLQLILAVPAHEAQDLIERCLGCWCERGWLTRVEQGAGEDPR